MYHAAIVAEPTGRPSHEDLRGAQRFTLLIRTAKLVSESGEFVAVIRDVSETGVRLKLFHRLLAEPRMALELANGEVYFIERVWERDGHAGFRFAAPIDVHAFIAEVSPYARRPLRLCLRLPIEVSAGGQANTASLCDLSQHGARIESARHLLVGQRVTLAGDGLPAITARVAWRSSPEYGLAFEQHFTLDALAGLAARLQDIAAVVDPDRKIAAI